MKRTHGDSAGSRTSRNRTTPELNAWKALKQRCLNPKNPGFADYGGRGITVCDRWRDSYENFLADMGRRPTPKHSLDRKDNDGPYSPENCHWTTQAEQNFNSRPRKLTDVIVREIRTSTESSRAIAQRLGISAATVKETRSGKIHSRVKP